MARMQSRTQQKRRLSKIIFWLAGIALILAIGLSIYVFCTRKINGSGQAGWPVPTKNAPSIFSSFIPSPTIYVLPTTYYPPASAPPQAMRAGVPITISFVHDGDTIYAKNTKQAIRLIGIDAPELAGSYRCGVSAKCTDTTEECGASEAKNKLMELILNKEVVLAENAETDSIDKHGRMLRYVYLCRDRAPGLSVPLTAGLGKGYKPSPTENDCLDLSLVLIQSGLARENGFGNSYSNQKQYRQAENEAKNKKLGIWGACL